MAERKRRGLGRGLGALIPDGTAGERPVDVFFSGHDSGNEQDGEAAEKPKRSPRPDPAATMASSRRRGGSGSSKPESSGAKGSVAEAGSDDSSSAQSSARKTRVAKSSTTASSTAKQRGAKPTSAAKKGTATKSSTASSKAKTSETPGTKGKTAAGSSQVGAPRHSKGSVGEASAAATTARGASRAKGSSPTKQSDVIVPSQSAPNEASTNDTTNIVSVASEVVETSPGVFTSSTSSDSSIRPSVQTTGGPSSSERSDVEAADESAGRAPAEAAPADVDFGSTDSESGSEDVSSGVESIADTEFGEVPVDLIEPNPRQPRTVFDEDQLAELVHSIREIGVLQPVVVRPKPDGSARYELIMGERRLRAAKEAELDTIPAIIRFVDDTDLLRDALLENLHRAELNPLEEAAAYGQLLEDFGCTQEELSERIGRSRPQISNTLRLLRLPPLVQRRVAAGVISAGHARAILGLKNPEHMEVLAQRVVAEGMSVRAAEEAVVLLNRGDAVNVSRGTSRVAPEFLAVAEQLGDRLDTKVNISVGKRKGKLSVEFANQEDLDRILDILGLSTFDS